MGGPNVSGCEVAIARLGAAWAVAATLTAAAMVPVAAQQPRAPQVGWLGLFNPALVEWLENENQMARLCGQFPLQGAAWYQCQSEKLAPKIHVVRLWAAPSQQAASVGSLLIAATPGQGLRSFVVGARGGAAIEFQVDLFDGDWGYGPWFHQTFVERRGDWFRLPEQPFATGTWLNAADVGGPAEVRLLEAGEIVSSPQGDLYILGFEPEGLRARPEQPADMWCELGAPPALQPWKEIRLPFRDLYTATGHLRLRIKYTRGC